MLELLKNSRAIVARGILLTGAVASLVVTPIAAHAIPPSVPEASTVSLFGVIAVPMIGMAVMLRNRRRK